MDKQKAEVIARKLLALAQNNNSTEEAEAALLQAQRLIVQHQLELNPEEQADLDAENVDKETVYSSGRIENWRFSMGSVIGKNFRCQFYKSQGKLVMMGLRSDLDVACKVYMMAVALCDSLAERYAVQNASVGNRRRVATDFRSGFVNGLNQKFKEQKEQNNWGLVLAMPAKVKAEAAKLGLVTVKTASYARSDGYSAGQREGQSFADSNGKRVHRGPRLLGPGN